VPGILNALLDPLYIKRCVPRPIDPLQGSWTIKVETLRGPTREIVVRKDAYMYEILALTFDGMMRELNLC
jgi:hypothetical protein